MSKSAFRAKYVFGCFVRYCWRFSHFFPGSFPISRTDRSPFCARIVPTFRFLDVHISRQPPRIIQQPEAAGQQQFVDKFPTGEKRSIQSCHNDIIFYFSVVYRNHKDTREDLISVHLGVSVVSVVMKRCSFYYCREPHRPGRASSLSSLASLWFL